LIESGSARKYIIYAIGEVALVVIGILIALQINNWNEERKEAQFERKMYDELIISIERNIEQLSGGILYSQRVIRSCNIILEHFEKDLPYQDSLDRHFAISLRWWHPSLGSQAYESLKNHYGLHIINNDSIRNRLGLQVETEWMDFLITQQEDYFANAIAPNLIDLFKEYSVEKEMEPYDFDQLKTSKKYNHILRTSLDMRERQIKWYENSVKSRENTIEMIRRELGKN
jgi:hypothetical protein